MKIIEPCCYIKQLNQWIGEDGDTSFLYHNGDVLLSNLFYWMLRRCSLYPGLDVTLALPSVTENFLHSLRDWRKETVWSSRKQEDFPLIRSLSVITRDANALADYTDVFDNIAVTKNLALQAVTMRVPDPIYTRCMTLTGGIVQAISPGPHLIVITKTPEKYNLIQPLLDSHIRLHRIKL